MFGTVISIPEIRMASLFLKRVTVSPKLQAESYLGRLCTASWKGGSASSLLGFTSYSTPERIPRDFRRQNESEIGAPRLWELVEEEPWNSVPLCIIAARTLP